MSRLALIATLSLSMLFVSCEQPAIYDLNLYYPDDELATITGIVSTSFGYPLSYVYIEIGSFDDRSDFHGRYHFSEIEPGRYSLRTDETDTYYEFNRYIYLDPGPQEFDFSLVLTPTDPDIRVSLNEQNEISQYANWCRYSTYNADIPLIRYHLHPYYGCVVHSAKLTLEIYTTNSDCDTDLRIIDIPQEYYWTAGSSGGMDFIEVPSFPVLFETRVDLGTNDEITREYDITDYINSVFLGLRTGNGFALLNSTSDAFAIGSIKLALE